MLNPKVEERLQKRRFLSGFIIITMLYGKGFKEKCKKARCNNIVTILYPE